MPNEFLKLNCKIAASGATDDQGVKIRGTAYTGKKMNVGWGDSIVLDLSGLTIPKSVPLLADHTNKTDHRLGHVSASVENNELSFEGGVTAESDKAKNIIKQAKRDEKDGVYWQLSIGASISQRMLIEEGTKTINGQEHTAPFYHIVASRLFEISVVCIGADSDTHMQIAASLDLNDNSHVEGIGAGSEDGESTMKNQEQGGVAADTGNATNENTAGVQASAENTGVQAAATVDSASILKAERARVTEIEAACGNDYPEIKAAAIADGLSVAETSVKVLAALRAGRVNDSFQTGVKAKVSDKTQEQSIEAGLLLRSGVSESELVASYGEQAVEAGEKRRDHSLFDITRDCVKLEGGSISGSRNDVIKAGFSTVSLPAIVSNIAHKSALKAYSEQNITATSICSKGSVSDFKPHTRVRLVDQGDLEDVSNGGEFKHGGLADESVTNQVYTYGKMLQLTREMIVNDDLGTLSKMATNFGTAAKRKIEETFYKLLLSNPTMPDGVALFHADHKNLLSTAAPFSHGTFEALTGLFLDQTDSEGRPINVEPQKVLVPNNIYFSAKKLLEGTTLISTGGDGGTVALGTDKNIYASMAFQLLKSAWLTMPSLPGYSAKSWYQFANPSQVDTCEIAYLNGREAPTIERVDAPFNTLGVQWRVYIDFGMKFLDTRGVAKYNVTS